MLVSPEGDGGRSAGIFCGTVLYPLRERVGSVGIFCSAVLVPPEGEGGVGR